MSGLTKKERKAKKEAERRERLAAKQAQSEKSFNGGSTELRNDDDVTRNLEEDVKEVVSEDINPVEDQDENIIGEDLTNSLSVESEQEESGEEDLVAVGDEPIEDEPIEDEPIEDEPIEDEPIEDEPIEDEPIEDEPIEDEPIEDEPIEDEPIEDEPIEDEPIEDEPIEDEPIEDDSGEFQNDDLDLYEIIDDEPAEEEGPKIPDESSGPPGGSVISLADFRQSQELDDNLNEMPEESDDTDVLEEMSDEEPPEEYGQEIVIDPPVATEEIGQEAFEGSNESVDLKAVVDISEQAEEMAQESVEDDSLFVDDIVETDMNQDDDEDEDEEEDLNEGFEPDEEKPPVIQDEEPDEDPDFEAFDADLIDDDSYIMTDEDIFQEESVGKDILVTIDDHYVPDASDEDDELVFGDTIADVPDDGITEEIVREQVAKKKGLFGLFGKKNNGFEVPEEVPEEPKSETTDVEMSETKDVESDVNDTSSNDEVVDLDVDDNMKETLGVEAKPEKVKLTRAEKKEQRKRDLEIVKLARAEAKGKKVKVKVKSEDKVDDEPVEQSKPVETSVKQDKKKKKKNGMSQVLSESVVEAVWPDFLENENFTMTRDNQTVGIALFFDTNSIGGFNKKSRNDESKGSIIEAITSGMLKHLLTEKLMDDECIVFIPCEESMSVIIEHSILYNAQYTICFVYSNGSVELTDIETTAQEIERLIRDDIDVAAWLIDKLPEDEVIEQQVEELFNEDEEPAEETPEINLGYDEFIGDDPDDDYQEDMYSNPSEYDSNEMDMEEYDPNQEYTDMPDDDEYDREYDDGEDVNEEEPSVIPYDKITETIVKTFYPTDLDLKISTESFDGRFIHGNPYVPFEEVRATKFDENDTYIDTAISELVKDCNTQLQSLHDTNLFKLRGDYFKLISMACARISKSLDVDDPDTEVGQMQILLDESYEEKKAKLDDDIIQRKEQLEKEWHDKVEKAAADAAEVARKTYYERYRRAHDEEMAYVQPNLTEELETYYKTENQKIHEKRRHDAEVSLEKYDQEILNRLDDVYKKMLDEETELRNRWRDELKNYIEEHRKSEFARSQALAEELAQVTKADVVRREMSVEVDKIRATFAADREQWLSQTEATHRQHIEELRQKDQLFEDKVQEMTSEKEHLEEKVNALNEQLDRLNDMKDKEYKSRVNQLENEAKSWKAELEHQNEKHRRQNVITAALAIIAIVAALSIGFIGGAYVNLKADRVSTTQSLFDEIDDRLVENQLIEDQSVDSQSISE